MLNSCQNIFNLSIVVVLIISSDIICTFFIKNKYAFTHIIVGIRPTSIYQFAVNELTMGSIPILFFKIVHLDIST